MFVRNTAKSLLTKGDVKKLLENTTTCHYKMKTKLQSFCAGCFDKEKSDRLRTELADFGLTEFEIVNIIDTKPNGLVHLQNIIEEMMERLTEDQMKEIIAKITNI